MLTFFKADSGPERAAYKGQDAMDQGIFASHLGFRAVMSISGLMEALMLFLKFNVYPQGAVQAGEPMTVVGGGPDQGSTIGRVAS